eukprot:TRINITY_DN37857_c0_g1_i1.p1 TRINITY_DN37857_c0_g1~~TRINITY_DN37857_c0_g1_i1.p1  ORF type:complete len:723 (-),score=210.08 TRINITY_DN37857_c0_g1_i1:141-2309(-)
MQSTMKLASSLALVAIAAEASDLRSAGPGITKVVSMLNDMAATAKKEKQEEEVAFAKFQTFCGDESARLKKEISANGQEVEVLSSGIASLQSDAKTLGGAVAELQTSVSAFEADRTKQTKQRKEDNAAFLAEAQDYTESISALERALMTLQSQAHDRPASAALAELSSVRARAPTELASAVAALQAFSQSEAPAGLSYDAPQANAYEFQSSSIVDLLKRLKDEFRSKLSECQKQEMNSKHAFEMIKQDLSDSIEIATKDISEKSAEKERKVEAAAADKKRLAATQATKKSNEDTLAELSTECKEKRFSFDEKQQLRGEEIEAIQKAVEILSSPEVAGNGNKYFSFSQGSVATALPQFLRSNEGGAAIGARGSAASVRSAGIHRRAREYLATEGKRLHNKELASFAETLSTTPFSKVAKMIESLINRLMEEANTDASHEGYCDTEMGKSKLTRAKLNEDIESLNARVEEGKSTALKLTQLIENLSEELAALEKAMTEAVEMRASEKQANAATVKDAKDAQKAVTAALAVLKDFYAKALATTAFVQTNSQVPKMGSDEWTSLANPSFKGTVDKGHKEGMQTFGAAYKGQQDKAGGVLALLEVVLSDFASLEADTNADEATSAKSHKDFMTQCKKDKAVKSNQLELSQADKIRTEEKIHTDTADLKGTQDSLLAAQRYYEKLAPQCVDQGMSFDERAAARQAEIASLKEALKILGGADADGDAQQ